MRKYLKRKNKAVAFIAIALMLCTLCALPCSASSEWVEIMPDEATGHYSALASYEGKLRFVVNTGVDYLLIKYRNKYNSVTSVTINANIDSVGTVDELYSMWTSEDWLNSGVVAVDEGDKIEELINFEFWLGVTHGGEFHLYQEVKTSEKSSTLVGEMFSSFRAVIDGLTNGIKGMFNNILWVDGTAQSGLSHFAKFGFVMSGLSLALGLGYVIISKIGR